ncbi:IS21 family transposase, partial [Bifidobacterium longum]|nr:IS21 family transposase [Bifidobacterium longum]MBV3115380.1 IS21 family transposase [Bifidobacterium longum]
AEYPRQYGRSRNVEDPALVLPRLAVKPRAWRESSIRPDVPDDIRAWLDSMDEKTLRESLKAIGDACRAAGFDPAMQACGEILRSNRDMGLHADSLTPIALRMRDGEWEYPGGIEEPDLSGYDRFITGTDDGGEER